MKIVCDTNIIIDFAKLNKLNLLKNLFEEVIIPEEVREELLVGDREDEISKMIDEWIKVKKVKDMLALESLKAHMGKGEAASIVLYDEIRADLLAINDLKARGVAHAMGVRIIGTLGILKLAKERGLLKKIKPLLDKLKEIGAYIDNGLYKRILADVKEE